MDIFEDAKLAYDDYQYYGYAFGRAYVSSR